MKIRAALGTHGSCYIDGGELVNYPIVLLHSSEYMLYGITPIISTCS